MLFLSQIPFGVLGHFFCIFFIMLVPKAALCGESLWQNPVTGRVVALPSGVTVQWGGVNATGIQFENPEKDINIYITEGDESFYDDDPASDNRIDFKPNSAIAGYPIQYYDSLTMPCAFHMDVDGQMWGIEFLNCNQSKQYAKTRALFDAILPSLVPLKSNDVFELIIPWSEQKIRLNQIGLNSSQWNAYALNLLLDADGTSFDSFFLKNSKASKNYDGLLNINGENVYIIVSNRQVNPENLADQLTASTLKDDNGNAIIAYKKANIAGRTVLKGQYIDEMEGSTRLESHYLIPLKNRIWTLVSSVYQDDKGNYPNAAQRIDIIEQIIATLPDNPPDIVTTYTNPQTKKQLKLPKGWAVVQDFPDGEPKDLGIVELDKVENTVSISYACGKKIVASLEYSMTEPRYYKKSRFANQNVFIRDDMGFDLYVKDQSGACHLRIHNFDKEKDKDILPLAEKLLATGLR